MTDNPQPTPQPQPFRTNHEMRQAMKESKQKFGAWNKDPSLMKRIEATPQSIQTAI